jgi:RimJ/RimL family protein N-acetyltransferase
LKIKQTNIKLSFVQILETKRLILRETTVDDAEFMLDLLNQPSFIKYIGDRNVRTIDESKEFIETRYRQSYRDNGFGLYVVEAKDTNKPVGICGFVKRDTLPAPDIGFAFLPQFCGQGFAVESAEGSMKYGEEVLGFTKVLAITTQNNESSGKLLFKVGFNFVELVKMPHDEEELKLFSWEK